jgi:hypothetical protein
MRTCFDFDAFRNARYVVVVVATNTLSRGADISITGRAMKFPEHPPLRQEEMVMTLFRARVRPPRL